jgi:lactate dehydrogenase-like 2-hydroxyacid dehydrogenase
MEGGGEAVMKDVHVLQAANFPPWINERLAAEFTVHRYDQAKDKPALGEEVAPQIRAIATSAPEGADRALISSLPKLEIISSFAVGVDPIDLACAKERGVIVTNTAGVLTDCVADLGMALILAIMRRIVHAHDYVRSGDWATKGTMGLTAALAGKKLGIVGLGRIGLALAKRAEAFGMQVQYQNRRRRSDVSYPWFADAVSLAKASDVLALVVPGGAETKHMIDAKVLDALGPKGFLVNIARGSVVDEAALIEALKERRIAGAALDVFAEEPRKPEDFAGLDNVVLQPHHASATVETRTAMGNLMIDNLLRRFRGEPTLPQYRIV